MSREPEEERFARQDSRRYSGWSSAVVIAVIVIVLGKRYSLLGCHWPDRVQFFQ
jgi:hypothetical protein